MARTPSKSLRTLTLYPTFIMYVAGVAVAAAIVQANLPLSLAIEILSIAALFIVMFFVMREIRCLHALMIEQEKELLLHIDSINPNLDIAPRAGNVDDLDAC